jgi:hypothetical protein
MQGGFENHLLDVAKPAPSTFEFSIGDEVPELLQKRLNRNQGLP